MKQTVSIRVKIYLPYFLPISTYLGPQCSKLSHSTIKLGSLGPRYSMRKIYESLNIYTIAERKDTFLSKKYESKITFQKSYIFGPGGIENDK
jgi:hypothetical protein